MKLREYSSQDRSHTRRREIIQAALACFVEHGYSAATMEDIRRRSKASNGSIYHHFKSKEQLAAAVYLEGIIDYQAGFMAEMEKTQRRQERDIRDCSIPSGLGAKQPRLGPLPPADG